MRVLCLGAGALLWILAGSAPAAQGVEGPRPDGLVIQARLVYTMAEEEGVPDLIEEGMIRIRNGKVEAVGRNLAVPEGWSLLHFPDGVILPGLVAADTRLVPSTGGRESVSAAYRAADGFDPYGDYRLALAGGVTTAYLDPGTRRLLSGTGAVVKLAGPPGPGRILRDGGDLCINLGEDAFNPPPLQEYPLPPWSFEKIEPARRQRPTARMGQYVELREAFARARTWKGEGADPFDFQTECLARALAGRPCLRIRALRTTDLEGALRILRETGLTGYVEGALEAHRLKAALKAAGVPVVLEVPVSLRRPARDRPPGADSPRARLETAAELAAAGVPFALILPFSERVGDLMLAAAAAVRGGLDRGAALLAVTRRPAEILGVADRVGSLAPGKDADLVVLSGEPLRMSTHVLRVFVEGREVFRHPAPSEALVVRAGCILTAAGPPIEPGELLVEKGKITAVGRTVPHPPGARTLDAGPGTVVTPGFIDGYGHLGLEGDKSVAGTDTCLADAVYGPEPGARAVCRAGITTVLLAPWRASSRGALLSALKTWAPDPETLCLSRGAAIRFSIKGQDPRTAVKGLESALKAGKAYVEKWNKYFEALKKWEEARKKDKTERGVTGVAPSEGKAGKTEAGSVKKNDEGGKGGGEENNEGEMRSKKKGPDPITGTWEYEVAGGPMPRPLKGTLKLKQEEEGRITGTGTTFFRRGAGEEVGVEGTLQDKKVFLEIDVETPAGKPTVEAELDEEDHMTGTFRLGDVMELGFEARRTEKEEPVIMVKARRRKKGESGRPEPPEENPALEPYRRLFSNRACALVEADTVHEIEAVVHLFVDLYKVPLVLLGARDGVERADRLKAAGVAVVLLPEVVGRRRGRPFNAADAFSRAGVPVIFGSDAEDGARALPLNAIYAVYNGMDPGAALAALTSNPARFFRLEDRVGVLAAGRDGDFIVFSGPPFEMSSRVLHVFVKGKEVKP